MRVSVIGGARVESAVAERAERVGRVLAERGHTIVCGGRGGVMEATCRGARGAGGETIGILPGPDRSAANEFVTTPIATGMGNARNVLVVCNGDGAIAIDGATGTLSEIAHALDFGRPVAGLDTHPIPDVEAVSSAEEAVRYVEDHA
jgi:uncharacterized protein (TIGR00725 family)